MITACYMVKNEERFIKASILSVLPFVSQVLIFDTGSTDSTIEVIKSIKSEKINLFETLASSPVELTAVRQKMLDWITTKWFLLIDGDEVYDNNSMKVMQLALYNLPENAVRIEVGRLNFVFNFSFTERKQFIGRIFKTESVKFVGLYPFEELKLKSGKDLNQFSTRIADVTCFHFGLLKRSSRDVDVEVGRNWRDNPLIVIPYFGIMPETLKSVVK